MRHGRNRPGIVDYGMGGEPLVRRAASYRTGQKIGCCAPPRLVKPSCGNRGHRTLNPRLGSLGPIAARPVPRETIRSFTRGCVIEVAAIDRFLSFDRVSNEFSLSLAIHRIPRRKPQLCAEGAKLPYRLRKSPGCYCLLSIQISPLLDSLLQSLRAKEATRL